MAEEAKATAHRSREAIQEAEYGFPYHFVPRPTEDGFAQSITVRWGYLYWSYLSVVLDLLEDWQPASVLDVGCGDGRLVAEAAARLPGGRILGVDTSPRAVALARAMAPTGEFRVGNVAEPDCLTESFEAMTMVEVLEHIPEPGIAEIRQSLVRHLEPDGRLIVTVPTTNLEVHPKHYQHFDLASLEASLAPDFVLTTAYHLNRRARASILCDRLLTNRLFAIRHPRILGWWLDLYRRRFLHATPANAMRICAVFKAAGRA